MFHFVIPCNLVDHSFHCWLLAERKVSLSENSHKFSFSNSQFPLFFHKGFLYFFALKPKTIEISTLVLFRYTVTSLSFFFLSYVSLDFGTEGKSRRKHKKFQVGENSTLSCQKKFLKSGLGVCCNNNKDGSSLCLKRYVH